MTTPQEAIQKYERTPFEMYDLRGKEFTILESQLCNKGMREANQPDKWGKSKNFFFLTIECGLFQKDLRMTENEMLALFFSMPKTIENYRGSIIKVHESQKLCYTYMGQARQDSNGNRLDGSQSAPISQPQQPHDQRDLFLSKLLNSIQTLDELGNKVDAAYVMKICENISPGKALDLFQYAKTKGAISEHDGSYKVNK